MLSQGIIFSLKLHFVIINNVDRNIISKINASAIRLPLIPSNLFIIFDFVFTVVTVTCKYLSAQLLKMLQMALYSLSFKELTDGQNQPMVSTS